MKRLFFYAAILLLSFPAYSQIQLPYLKWEKNYGGSDLDALSGISNDIDGGYVLAGMTRSTDKDVQSGVKGGFDAWVVKTDTSGLLLWEKTYGGSEGDQLQTILTTPDSGYIFGGITASKGNGSGDIWIIKLDKIGAIQWEKTLGGSDHEFLSSVNPTSDGGYIIGGITNSSDGDIKSGNKGNYDFWLVKITSTGSIQWEKTYGGSKDDKLESVQPASDGGYILGGWTESSDGDIKSGIKGYDDYWIIKVDGLGTIEWEKSYGGTRYEQLQSVLSTPDGGYLLAGWSDSSDGDIHSGNKGYIDVWVVKINGSGVIEWEKTYGGGSDDRLESVGFTSDGGYLLGVNTLSNDGDVQSGNKGSYDIWMIKINEKGTIQWEKTFGGSYDDQLQSVQSKSDGGFVIGGTTNSIDGDIRSGYKGDYDFWVIKVNLNYPPFVPSQTIVIPENSPVGVTSYLIQGSDKDHDTLTYSKLSGNDNGKISVLPDGTIELLGSLDYETQRNYDLTVEVTDGKHSVSVIITIQVQNVRDTAPVTLPDEYHINEDNSLAVPVDSSVLKNDSADLEGDVLTAVLYNNVSHGNLLLNSDGTFIYTPEVNYYGTDNFSYIASDGFYQSVPSQVTIFIEPVNDAPSDIQISPLIENSPIGTILQIIVTDVDDTEHTNSLVSGPGDNDNNLFAMQNNHLQTTTEIDYELKREYNLRIKSVDQGGLSVEKAVVLNIINLNDIVIMSSVINNTYCGDDETGSVKIEVAQYIEPLTFNWSSGDVTQNIINKPSGSYTVIITDGAGFSISQTFEVGIEPVYAGAQVCYVSSDESDFTKNRIYVNKGPNPYNVDTYLVYREGNTAGAYDLIGEIPISENSFIDPTADSRTRSYSYKVGIRDSCGNTSALSTEHRTLHLSANEGINKEVNLSWTSYEGLSFGTYAIFRKRGNDEFIKIAEISSNNNTYTDLDRNPDSTYFYYVAVLLELTCTQSGSGRAMEQVAIRSNIFEIEKEVSITGIGEPPDFSNKIYPNPAHSTLILELDPEYVRTATGIDVINITGQLFREIHTGVIKDKMEIEITSYPSGFYFLRLRHNKGSQVIRFIKN